MDDEDCEVMNEEMFDEFSEIFLKNRKSKILLTTSLTPSAKMFPFLKEIKSCFPNCYYYPREKYSISEIVEHASKREYSCLMVWRESRK